MCIRDRINPNWILNGDFTVSTDPNNGVSISSQAYFNDVWFANPGSGACTPTITALTVGSTPILPNPPRCYLKYQQTTNSSSSPGIGQRIEDARSLAGKTVTLSFWASSAANLTTRNISLTQYFGSGGSPSASVQTVLSSGVSVTSTWTFYTLTASLPAVTGKTLGTDNISYLQLDIFLPINSTYTFNITNVKLEVGSFATTFDNSWEEQARVAKACERYYQVIAGVARFTSPLATPTMWTPLAYRSIMRANPTPTVLGTVSSANVGSISIGAYTYGGLLQLTAAGIGDTYVNTQIGLSARL